MKKEYETVWEIFNECANNQMRDVFFDEIETDDPEAYIRQKFPDKNLKYENPVCPVLLCLDILRSFLWNSSNCCILLPCFFPLFLFFLLI